MRTLCRGRPAIAHAPRTCRFGALEMGELRRVQMAPNCKTEK